MMNSPTRKAGGSIAVPLPARKSCNAWVVCMVWPWQPLAQGFMPLWIETTASIASNVRSASPAYLSFVVFSPALLTASPWVEL